MKRRDFLHAAGGTLASAALAGHAQGAAAPQRDRPNILWITCEDISPHLGCYGDPEARTPNLDRLAGQGARYTNAFSISGVCAPSRSCLITGMYPTTLGTHHMRCDNPPPPHVKCFPEYLREAGYYRTNNVKTDYNFAPPPTAWDECSRKAHWRNRPDKDQPFFAVFNFTITHESQVGKGAEGNPNFKRNFPPEERHDPAKAQLPPYYPDTPLVRKHWAHYYDLITFMDRQAGDILEQLEEDGLAENTVVFFFSDHGVGLPRAKRWMYDSGIHVPFIVRWPGHVEPNTATDRLVSFVDFAPTALSLAGVSIPGHMQGRAFLGGQAAPPREHVFSARDRMDERYDIIRAVRDKRFKYIRNYEPDRPYAQHLDYPEGWPVMQEMRRVHEAGQLTQEQKLFFRDTKPLEELYDLSADPHEIHNLAESPEHQAVLKRMRRTLDEWILTTKDLGLVPEIELPAWRQTGGKKPPRGPTVTYEPTQGAGAENGVFGRPINEWIEALNGADPFARLQAIRALGLIGSDALPALMKSLHDPSPSVAYWGAVGLGHLGIKTDEALKSLEAALEHPAVAVRLAAAQALCRLGGQTEALDTVLEAATDEDPYVRLCAVQILEEIGPKVEAVREALEKATEDELNYVVRVAEHALKTG